MKKSLDWLANLEERRYLFHQIFQKELLDLLLENEEDFMR